MKEQDIRAVLLLVGKFLDRTIPTRQPFIRKMHRDAVDQSFARRLLLASWAVIQTGHSILCGRVQTAQSDGSVRLFRLISKNIDYRLRLILLNVLDRTPSRGRNLRMVHIFRQEMSVLLEKQ